MEGPPLGPGGEDITLPDQVAPRGRKASSIRKIKPQTSNLTGGMNLKVLDTTIAGSGYRNPASRPRKSCGTWTKRTQHSSAPSPLTNGVCPDAACRQIDKGP